MGVLPGVVATLQSTEVIKVLLEIGDVASGKLLIYDALRFQFKQLPIKKRNDYEIKELINYDQFCGVDTMENNEVKEIDVNDLNTRIQEDKNLVILDVREPFEYEICHLDESTLIPLGNLESELDSLDKSKNYVVHCKLGGRSAKAVELMQNNGFKNVENLKGGITAWAEIIDQSMEVY